MFKKSFLILAALAYVSPSVYAEKQTIWTQGTNNGKDIFDADKSKVASGALDSSYDSMLCWAASDSNLIAWWQRQNPQAAAAAKAPTDINDIWKTYREAFTNQGGDTSFGLEWWFTGRDKWNKDGLPASKDSSLKGGYYSGMVDDAWDLRWYPDENPEYNQKKTDAFYGHVIADTEYTEYQFPPAREQLSVDIKDLLNTGYAISLSIGVVSGMSGVVDNKGGGHAITLWGIEYDDSSSLITRMWISDSDDIQYVWGDYEHDHNLVELTLSPVTIKGSEATFQSFAFTSEDVLPENYKTRNFYDSNTPYAIMGYTFLRGTADMLVPEPATATLCLAALAACMGRRRRRA